MKFLICMLILMINKSTIQNIFISEGDDPQDEYCASYKQNQCKLCYMSILFNGKCRNLTSENTVSHCLQYADKSNCLFCQLNYIPNEEGKCVRVNVDNCVQSNLQGKCKICEAGYLVKDGQCNKQDKCSIENCQFCFLNQGLEDCFYCQEGYVNKIIQDEKGASIKCVQEGKTPNCLNLKIDSDECNVCRINYYMNEVGECIKSTKYNSELIGSNLFLMTISFVTVLLY